jgi:flagella basal body P-ring formation protein FlgA
VLTDVPRASKSISRNSTISQGDIEITREWVAPSESRLVADASALHGRHAVRAIDKGETLRQRDVRGEAVVQKGDHVKVRKVVGACVITLDAEAMSSAAAGEGVELARIGIKGRRDRKTFMATVTGVGEAVLMEGGAGKAEN